ncbi:MAG: serine hydrolase [Bacteroidota bacterium]
MKKSTYLLGIALVFFLFTCQIQAQNPLQDLIDQNKATFGDIFDRPDHYEVQIIYTQIDRDENNFPHFQSHYYRLDSTNYFYPASTVKMPTAFVALEKLNQLKIKGLNKETPMRNGVGSAPQTEASVDASAKNLLPSIAHYIKKIFLVSDNDAYNRLYEFVGQAELNQRLHEKEFADLRLIHRLSTPGYNYETSKYTNPVTFYSDDKLLYHQGEVYSETPKKLNLQKEIKGKGYANREGEIVNEPFDFSTKNYVSLQNLHDLVKTVLFPQAVLEKQRFDLTEEDYAFLYKYMSMTPKASDYPKYDKPDGYVKFFMYGGNDPTIPDHIKIFNKVGDAYGYLTDAAYIIDTKNKVEFMVAATIHVNENRIYNDGVYEYDTTGFPFFKNLGNLIYEMELKRERKVVPDFKRFLME